MKLLMMLGAILGFGIGFAFSLFQQSPWPNVLWHAGIAAYVAGMLLRWWGRLWERNLRLALIEKESVAARPNSTSTFSKS
jgi:hypothetical protein